MVEFVPFLVMYIMLMTLLKKLPGKPWIIFIAIVGMIYGFVTSLAFKNIKPLLLKDKYPEMKNPAIWDFEWMSNKKNIRLWDIFIGSAEVSFVAVLETLISGRIADNRTGTRFDQPKEIFGMSLGNILSGFMGGTPCTGVLVRTGVNIQTGATDKMSQLINAIVLLFMTVIFMPAFVYVPLPCVAAILIVAASRLVP